MLNAVTLQRLRLALAAAMLTSAAGWLDPLSASTRPDASSISARAKPCADEQLYSTPIAARLRELLLTPGPRPDYTALLKDPEIAEFIDRLTRRQAAASQHDWAGLCRYRTENARKVSARTDVVFLGDSITENWSYADPGRFSASVTDRGISGQTSSQILLRFYPDVVALRPHVVHIMAGTNDILHDVGAVGDDDIVNNINSMIDIAQANGIKVVLASVPPISKYALLTEDQFNPARVIGLNARLRKFAAARRVVFADYYSALADTEGGLRADLGNDGVHPNRHGYAVMQPIASQAIAAAKRGGK